MQFGFRETFSTSHALINLTENIRDKLLMKDILDAVYLWTYKKLSTQWSGS